MHVRTFSDPSDYLETVQPLLEMDEPANNLILGISARLVEHPEWTRLPPFLATVEDDQNNILLVALMTPPNNLLLNAVPGVSREHRDAAVDVLVEYLDHSPWTFPGVNAENSLAEAFAAGWSEASGQPYRVKMREGIYELRQVIPPPNPPPGFLRPATLADFDLLARWHYAFTTEAMGEGDPEESRRFAASRIPQGDLFIWDDQGPVSCAIRSRPTRHGHTVSFVYTPPEKRGRGYASACVAALSQRILESGKQFCCLFTDLANPTSNDIYQKIGYRPIGEFTEYRFNELTNY
jgi:predicted GNAT family acetyltransferase